MNQFFFIPHPFLFRRDVSASVILPITFDTFAATRPVVSATVVNRFWSASTAFGF